MIERALADRIVELLKKAKRIICVTHRNPDGDAIGSITGFAQLLEAIIPNTPLELKCTDPAPPVFDFLPFIQRITHDIEPKDGDVFVFLDAAEPKLTDYHITNPEIFGGDKYPSIVFDHHPTNSKFGSENIVIADASSTCEILVAFAEILQWPLTPGIATSLMTGIFTDTGGLLHSNTKPETYRAIAKLLRAGAGHSKTIQHVFRTAKITTLRLWGRVLEKITLTPEGGAISALTEGDFEATGADYSELTGAIDYVNAIPGMKFSLLLAERGGKVKGSLRTLRDDVDVSEMASAFQGGGHRKAAGFAVEGKLVPEVRWKVETER